MEAITESPFVVHEGKGELRPLVISIPHCGTDFPADIKGNYQPGQVKSLDDTDWFLQQLYAFAIEMGITIVEARYSRWVIDLNRDPESAPLYNDGRIITGLTTTTDFLGNPIYLDGKEPDENEVKRRLEKYYWPYYRKIQTLLDQRKEKFGNAVLWDAHSIREFVPSIRSEKFPQMILGNADETSADPELTAIALDSLRQDYQVNHNDPFKGGHITRYFGNPSGGIHALQLERNKNCYMDDNERVYDSKRAEKMQVTLKRTLTKLIEGVKKL